MEYLLDNIIKAQANIEVPGFGPKYQPLVGTCGEFPGYIHERLSGYDWEILLVASIR